MNAFANLRFDLVDGSSFNRSLEQGMHIGQAAREAQERKQTRSALAAAALNPDDPIALAAIFERSPDLGMKLMDRADARSFNRDLGVYLGGQPNALLGVATNGEVSAPRNAFLDAFPSGSSNDAGQSRSASGQPQSASLPARATDAPASQGGNADLAFLGKPQGEADNAFLRMLRRDPERALKVRSQLRDNFVDRLGQEQELYGIAVQSLSSVQDEAGWQQALERLAPMAQAIGGDLFSVVPRTYPGPDGVRDLLERALPVKERLDFLLREANVNADNERADRNTDSMIDTREARAAEYARNNRERSSNQRRGQDLTDNRVRSPGAARQRIVTVGTPDEARRLAPGTRYRGPDGVVRER